MSDRDKYMKQFLDGLAHYVAVKEKQAQIEVLEEVLSKKYIDCSYPQDISYDVVNACDIEDKLDQLKKDLIK